MGVRVTRSIAGMLAVCAMLAVIGGTAASAQTSAAAVVAQHYDRFYVWADGSYQHLMLASVALGEKDNLATAFVSRLNPKVTGYGVSGGFGYVLPPGVMPGSNARIEVSGAFTEASGNDAQLLTSYIASSVDTFTSPVLLNGATSGTALGCNVIFLCTVSTTLRSDYTAWRLAGRVASDFVAGNLTITPWVGVLAGRSSNDQSYAQTVVHQGISTTTYKASWSLRWTDVGARVGLDTNIHAVPGLAFGLNGNVGVVHRKTSLDASDVKNPPDNFSLPGPVIVPSNSSISSSATANAMLLNGEASVTAKPTSAITARAFAGVVYDNQVPGIVGSASPGFGAASGQPAGIKFESTTSYYVGGGAHVAFGAN